MVISGVISVDFGDFGQSCYRQYAVIGGGAKVLGKLSVPGRPTNLDNSRARAYCACSRCGWGCLDIFSLVYLFFLPLFGRRLDHRTLTLHPWN